MSNEEKAALIADQCKPCTDDFYSGIKQGVILALNAEEEALKKADKWDALDEKIADCYGSEDPDTGEWVENETEGMDLGTIGEIASIAFGYL